jgi:hypothetical protein
MKPMKFATDRPFANIDAAVKKLLEIANAMEADHAGRLHIGNARTLDTRALFWKQKCIKSFKFGI